MSARTCFGLTGKGSTREEGPVASGVGDDGYIPQRALCRLEQPIASCYQAMTGTGEQAPTYMKAGGQSSAKSIENKGRKLYYACLLLLRPCSLISLCVLCESGTSY